MSRFAFLVHPRHMEDLARFCPQAAGKRPALVAKVLEWMPPYHLSDVTGVRSRATGAAVQGELICFPLFPHQIVGMDRRVVLERLVDAGRLAQERGARIVGLGGYTAVVGGSGRLLAGRLDIPVTSGNCYTVAMALEATARLAEEMDLDLRRAHVAIVGATGSIGAVCARNLSRRVGRLALLARSRSRLEALVKRLRPAPGCALAADLDVERGVREADIVISATSSGGGLIRSEWLKPGALVCDVGVPHDVPEEAAALRPDVLVLDGGIVEAPGKADLGFDIGYPPGLCMACMAETMALTLEGRFESFSIGRGLEYEDVEEIARIAARHGFRLAGFRSFGVPVTRDRLEEVRDRARRARRGLQAVPDRSGTRVSGAPLTPSRSS